MDDFIRRQYTYRRVYPNPLLKIERVWKETFEDEAEAQDDESDLGEVEEVEQQTLISWLELSIPQRVGVLHDLCEWQLHSDKFRERVGVTTELQATQWRISPVGSDAHQQIYYLLSSGRLYNCNDPIEHYQPTNKKRKRNDEENVERRPTYQDDWTCVASTYDEWQTLVKDLSKTRNSDERQLLKYLKEVALPYVEEVESAKRAEAARKQALEEKAEAERIKEMMRQELLSTRKRSSRIQMIDERKEAERERAEQLRKEQELEEKARAMARKEALGQGPPPPPKTREARLRDRELREALKQMHQRNGTNGHDDSDMADATPISGAQTPELRNGGHEQSQTTENANSETARHDMPATFGDRHEPDVVNRPQQNNMQTAQYTPEATDVNRAPEPLHNGRTAQNGSTMEVSAADVDWVNRKADQMTRGESVPHEPVKLNGHDQQPHGVPEAGPGQMHDNDQHAVHVPREGLVHNDSQNPPSNHNAPEQGRQQVANSESVKNSADIRVSQDDIAWVQRQADSLTGPQTVPQESTIETVHHTKG